LLIYQYFDGDSENLWITLGKTRFGCPGSLENQAFRQIAHPMGKIKSSIKSTTCKNMNTPVLLRCSIRGLQMRKFTFVHKSSARSHLFCKKKGLGAAFLC
jgi:hypothetical protein